MGQLICQNWLWTYSKAKIAITLIEKGFYLNQFRGQEFVKWSNNLAIDISASLSLALSSFHLNSVKG